MAMEKCYSEGPGGVSLKVRARAGRSRDAVVGVRAGELVVEVRAQRERGLANEAVRRVLAEALDVPRSEIVLKLGASSPRKVFLVPRSALPALANLPGNTAIG